MWDAVFYYQRLQGGLMLHFQWKLKKEGKYNSEAILRNLPPYEKKIKII